MTPLSQLEAALKPSSRCVLRALRTGPKTTHQLCQPEVGGTRFGARLGELRKAGWVWREERLPLPTRGSLYTLVSEPSEVPFEAETWGTPIEHEPERIPDVPPDLAAPAESPGGLFDADAFARPAMFDTERAA